MSPPIATIGYERATLPEVIAKLQAAKVELLVDVRAIASSRRAGFSKSLLRAGVEAAGVDYLHLRDLGTPKQGRIASRAGRKDEMRAIFAEHMRNPEAEDAFQRLKALAAERRVALLCFEACAGDCHRRELTERLARETAAKIVDL